MSQEKFQVSLGGIIELLSDHLYSTPLVFIRELIQNAADASSARRQRAPSHQGIIHIELSEGTSDSPGTLTVQDNGIGLSLDDVHQFLATIGNSSKRDDIAADDFIGQFGIGLLSCFVASDEIALITRSDAPSSKAVEWRGRSDGTYTVKEIDTDISVGTQVFLRGNERSEEFFTAETVQEAARYYGQHLEIPITVEANGEQETINRKAPWQGASRSGPDWPADSLSYAEEEFGIRFLDAFPLKSRAGGVEGVAYVLPFSSNTPQDQPHRVYLKGMLLTDEAKDLLPPWAFFVRCVVNARGLRPTASREALFKDDTLAEACEALGACVRSYLLDLEKNDPNTWDQLLAVHYRAIKALAVDDDDFYRIVIDRLPFETSLGRMTLTECLNHDSVIRYTPTYDQFGQLASVAAAQNICIVNAGYVFDTDLIEKLSLVYPDRRVRETSIDELAESFEDLPAEVFKEASEFVRLADLALHPFGCTTLIQRFHPKDLPSLYTTNESADFLRSLRGTQERSDDAWSSVLESLANKPAASAQAQLTFNHNSRLVRKLIGCEDKNLVGLAVQVLYVQAMILGRHPLRAKETALLSDGLLALIESAIGDREN